MYCLIYILIQYIYNFYYTIILSKKLDNVMYYTLEGLMQINDMDTSDDVYFDKCTILSLVMEESSKCMDDIEYGFGDEFMLDIIKEQEYPQIECDVDVCNKNECDTEILSTTKRANISQHECDVVVSFLETLVMSLSESNVETPNPSASINLNTLSIVNPLTTLMTLPPTVPAPRMIIPSFQNLHSDAPMINNLPKQRNVNYACHLMESFVYCALKGLEVSLILESDNYITFKIHDYEKMTEHMNSYDTSKRKAGKYRSRILSFRKWFPDMPYRPGKDTVLFIATDKLEDTKWVIQKIRNQEDLKKLNLKRKRINDIPFASNKRIKV